MKTAPKRTRNGFTEYTYVDGDRIEVMVHHRASDDAVIAVYTYRKDAEEINQWETGKGPITPFDWQEGKNPAFVHLTKGQIARFVRLFIDSGDLICTEREGAE